MSSTANSYENENSTFVYDKANESELLDLLFYTIQQKPKVPTSIGLLFSELNVITSVGTITQLKDHIEAVMISSILVEVLEKKISTTFRLSHGGLLILNKFGKYSTYIIKVEEEKSANKKFELLVIDNEKLRNAEMLLSHANAELTTNVQSTQLKLNNLQIAEFKGKRIAAILGAIGGAILTFIAEHATEIPRFFQKLFHK